MQAEPGYNAYVLGIIKCKDADKALIHLYKNTNNIFVEYTAARALFSIEEKDMAIKFLKEIVDDYFAINPKSSTQYDAFYVISSCWAISFEDKEYSINNLMKIYKNLEKFKDANALSRKKYLRMVLTNIAGEFFELQKM